MLKFSAVKGRKNGKSYYKDFTEVACELHQIGPYLTGYAISSYLYGGGVTDNGEVVENGHKAWKSVVDSGNILLLDFDTDIPRDEIEHAIRARGVSAFIQPSKSSSEHCRKWHVVVELDEMLPMVADEFKETYIGCVQWLGLEGKHDVKMEVPSQAFFPSWRNDNELFIAGKAIPCAEVRRHYTPRERSSVLGRGIHDYLAPDTVFTLSYGGDKLSVDEMVRKVKRHGKQRVHCIAGHRHGGQDDSALVNLTDAGEVFYFCSGNRCEGQGVLGLEPPFTAEVEQPTLSFTPAPAKTIWDWAKEASIIVQGHHVYAYAFSPEATVLEQEAAVSFVCRYILKQVGARMLDGTLCVFEGTQWVEVFSDPALLDRWIGAVCCAMPPRFHFFAHSASRMDAIKKMVKSSCRVAHLEHHINVLNLENCMLVIDKSGVKAVPHHPALLFKHTLPYEYDPKATAPVWEMVVDRVMCGRPELVKSLQHAFGYLLLRDTQYEKMIGLVGEGENGKSTVMRVLKWLVGRSGYSAVPLQQLVSNSSQGEYARAQLTGKLINITNELAPAAIEADTFKDMISGEDITARHIYGSPFTMEVVPKQLVAMNTTDRLVKERSHGFMRRLHLIPFDYKLREEDRDEHLNEKLYAELAGILNWCLEGAREVIAAGKLSKAVEMDHLLREVERDSNTVMTFVEDLLEVFDHERGGEVTKVEELYIAYSTYCEGNGNRPLNRRHFVKELERMGVTKVNYAYRIDQKVIKVSGFSCRLLKVLRETVILPFPKNGSNSEN